MAAWPSLHMEERNLLRQREWERRNQEAQQQQEQYQENAPLFGEPYKTDKGDELSSRIQRMLGNYEDMKDLHKNFGSMPKDLSASVPFGRPGRPIHLDVPKPPFQNAPLPYGGNQVVPATQLSKKSPAPDHTLLSSAYSHPSLSLDKGSPEPMDRKSEPWPEMASLPPALSPPSDPLSPLHSSDPSDTEQHDMDGKDSPGPRQPLQASSSGPSSLVDTSQAEAQMEGAPLACETAPLPSQTFPLPLSSKPSLVMPQKPWAYVRPMDGQDQVSSESPELKPSPDFDRQPYESLPDLKSISKPGLTQLKLPPPALEALSSDAQCVEEILREMTHTWPPLLTAIHTPSTADPPKFNFPNKESQHGHSGYSVQKHEAWRGSSSPPPPPPALSCQPEPPVAPARSSEGETASSSESESSSGSESDSESSESGGEELEEAPPPHIASPPPPAKADGPAVNEWQLGRWLELKDPQPSLSVETQGDALHCSPSSPASSPKPREETSTPQHYNSHSSPARPESASPAHYSYNSHISPVQPETTTPTHYNYNSHSSPVRTEPSTPPHYNYNSETTTPAHYNFSSHTSPSRPEVKDPESKPSGPSQHVRSQSPSPPSDVDSGARKTVANKKPSSSSKAPRPEDASRHVVSKELTSHQKDPSLADRPKVKTKAVPAKAPTKVGSKADKKAAKRTDKKKAKEAAPKVTVKLSLPKEAEPDSLAHAPPPPLPLPSVKSRSSGGGRSDGLPKSSSKKKKQRDRSPAQVNRPDDDAPGKTAPEAPRTLLVKIQLSLLTRVPSAPKAARPPATGGSAEPGQKRAERGDAAADAAPAKASRKRSAEKEDKSQPRKKLKLDKELKISSSPIAPSCPGSSKAEAPKTAVEEKERKKKKKKKEKAPSSSTLAPAAQEPAKGAGHKRPLADVSESKATGDGEVKHKKSSSKRSEHTKTGKKSPKSSFAVPEPAQPKRTPASNRVLLKLDDRQYSVEHHMKEAKKLKHKADAMSEKVGKSFIYLEAALSFVESGIAMEMDPQTPKSAYTMFSETVVLIRFILKLRSYSDPASPASEKDFAILCMRFQSLLQMAMFRYKREAALRYSRTLTDHFKSCKTSPSPRVSKATSTPSQMSPMASPASSSSSSHSSATAPANTVALPQAIHQVASTYVSITALFLSAHSVWEQAEEMAPKGSGVLGELDSAIGPLTLLSTMSAVVRYTRQGLHWLRQDSQQTH
ncbi:AF4/FMR2 family member 1 isoform X2 [Alosa sapidissima]|uniref:AF4/FMR2 family member 1 isoform X2 n=1 Tax=Alosa sapidissima TaxID=34773 RepID=UPI001C0883BE|nr:AF4/FMR2 family member 1 isoform X2 [Alosa sapidissima]